MGSYAHLEVAGFPFFSMKSLVDDTLMTLFDESDQRVFVRRVVERNPRAWCVDETDTEEETAYQYCVDAEHAKRRLDIQGFTMSRATEAFQLGLQGHRRDVEDGGVKPDLFWLPDEVVGDFLERYSLANWSAAIRDLVKPSFVKPVERADLERLDPTLRLVCESDSDDFFYGFPYCDSRLFMRAVLEVTGSTEPVILDYSELVHNGYCPPDKGLAVSAKKSVSSEFAATARIVVLTEGTTDATFLKQTLKILYPHLEPLYSFLDFAQLNMEGGAANLVRIVKGFVGTGIVNNIVAVFDNDTAASVALRALPATSMPENIAIVRYPRIPYATHYPTIGPQGSTLMDVNGLAGSIELYFGLDVLRQHDGELTPVQWRGYDQTLRQYQGELINKRALQEAYQRKLEMYGAASASITSADWSAMRLILEAIFTAFMPK